MAARVAWSPGGGVEASKLLYARQTVGGHRDRNLGTCRPQKTGGEHGYTKNRD